MKASVEWLKEYMVLRLLHLGPRNLDDAECRREVLLAGDEHPFGKSLTPQLRCFGQRQLERPFVGHEHDDVIQSLTRQLDVRAVILAGQFGHMLPHATDMPLQGFGTRLIGLGVLVVHESRKRDLGVDYNPEQNCLKLLPQFL